MEFKPLI